MLLQCMTGRHAAAPEQVENQGFHFSRCRRCRRDLIRSGHRWRAAPKGFRVVWKRVPDKTSTVSARQFVMDLPVTGRSLTVAPRVARSGLSDLIILGLLGLRYLTWIAGERVRALGQRLAAGRSARQPVIYLPPFEPSITGVPAR
jgi:hypothetical protein